MARHALAVYVDPVTAVQVLDDVLAIFQQDSRVRARRAIIFQDKMVVGLTSDLERQRVERDARTVSRGVDNDQAGPAAGLRGGRHHL